MSKPAGMGRNRGLEREVMCNPSRWPRSPWLSIKRWWNGHLEIGVIYGNHPSHMNLKIRVWGHDGKVQKTYKTIDAFLDDEWVVD